MTLEEKASLCSGLTFWRTKPIERLDVPSVWMSDGPHGLRKEKPTKGGGTNIMQYTRTRRGIRNGKFLSNFAESNGKSYKDNN